MATQKKGLVGLKREGWVDRPRHVGNREAEEVDDREKLSGAQLLD